MGKSELMRLEGRSVETNLIIESLIVLESKDMNRSRIELNCVIVDSGVIVDGIDNENGVNKRSKAKSGRTGVLNGNIELSSMNNAVMNSPSVDNNVIVVRVNEESNISVMGENGESNIIPVILNEDSNISVLRVNEMKGVLDEWKVISIEGESVNGVRNGEGCMMMSCKGEEYRLKVNWKNGLREGRGILMNKKNVIVGEMNFVNDKVNGRVLFRYENGLIRSEGEALNDRYEGEYREYDEEGNEVFRGVIRNGNKIELLLKREGMNGYWKKMNEEKEIEWISEYDSNRIKRSGDCFVFENGLMVRESIFDNDEEKELIREWKNGLMNEYEKGVRVYEGEWKGSIEEGFVREGKGRELNKRGKIVWEGEYENGKRMKEVSGWDNKSWNRNVFELMILIVTGMILSVSNCVIPLLSHWSLLLYLLMGGLGIWFTYCGRVMCMNDKPNWLRVLRMIVLSVMLNYSMMILLSLGFVCEIAINLYGMILGIDSCLLYTFSEPTRH